MEENKKLSYEELQEIAGQLDQQNKQLRAALQNADMVNMFKRIDYLFKVLESKNCFNTDFVITCAEEIQDVLTVKEEEKDDQTK